MSMFVRLVLVQVAIILTITISAQTVQSFAMTWKDTWSDILNGGASRWKVDDLDAKKIALAHIVEHANIPDGRSIHILCPLAGDDPFVQYAWSEGHHVTAIDIVPDALEAMRSQFSDDVAVDWSSESTKEGGKELVWKHKSGRATLIEGDMLMKRPDLMHSFDAIYDKDSFGALQLDMRPKFCERLSEFVKEGGTVYIEVKNKPPGGREFGPPYHVEKEDLTTAFGSWFEHVASLGEVYQLKIPGLKQTGHILRRVIRR